MNGGWPNGARPLGAFRLIFTAGIIGSASAAFVLSGAVTGALTVAGAASAGFALAGFASGTVTIDVAEYDPSSRRELTGGSTRQRTGGTMRLVFGGSNRGRAGG
jgi:hypothetical protein